MKRQKLVECKRITDAEYLNRGIKELSLLFLLAQLSGYPDIGIL